MNKQNVLRILSILLLFSVSFSFLAFGDNIEDAIKKQEALNKQIQETQKAINQKAAEQKKFKNELYTINSTLEKTNASLNEIKNSLEVSELNINKISEDISIKESEVGERSELLKGRLTDIYIKGEVKFLDVLFQATSFSDFLSRYEMMKIVAQKDNSLLVGLEEEKRSLDSAKLALEDEKSKLTELKSQRESRTNELSVASSRHKTVIANLTKEKSFYESMLDELEEQSKIIEQQIRAVQGTGGTSPSALNWPTPGYYRITSPYGYRIHPVLKTKRIHTGVDLGVPYGKDVVASNSGKVILAKYNGSYGYCLIIDHGGGMSTLYAHLSSFSVKVGDIVATGQKVAQIGTSGLSTGPHLHFEVRLSGSHTNPEKYLRR